MIFRTWPNPSGLAEVFVVMDEVGKLPLPVDDIARAADRASQGAGTTTEDSDFANLKSEQIKLN